MEVEPNLVDELDAGKLWGPDDPQSAHADEISLQQRANVVALLREVEHERSAFVDKVVRALAPADVWETFGAVQSDGALLKRIVEIERGGSWKIAGITAIGDSGNTADVVCTITDLVPGYALRATAKRTDPAELALNLPLRTTDGSFTLNVTGGAAADRVLVHIHLQRTGARLGEGSL